MPSTYSTNLRIELVETGEQSGLWGITTNDNLGVLIEQAISGYVQQAITDGADTVITIPDGSTGVARNMCLQLTGALTANRNLIVPTNKKLYFIHNATTGGYAVTVKVSGQTGVSVPNGMKVILVSNGTDVVTTVNYLIAPTFTTPVLGTPTSGTLTNCTGLPIDGGTINTLPVSRGGTGATTVTANAVILGNGTSPPLTVAAGTAGNILRDTGATWATANPASYMVTALAGTANQIAVSGSVGSVTISIPSNGNGYGVRTVSTGDPSGGSDGDVWYKYV